MQNSQKKDKLLRIMLVMTFLVAIAFFVFYLLLVDTFGVFTPKEQAQATQTEEKTSVTEDMLPIHGTQDNTSPYPEEEIAANIHTATQWIQTWFFKNNTPSGKILFPIQSYADFLASLRFSQQAQDTQDASPLTTETSQGNVTDTPVQNKENLPQEKPLLPNPGQPITPIELLQLAKTQITSFTDALLLPISEEPARKALINICVENITSMNAILTALLNASASHKQQFSTIVNLENTIAQKEEDIQNLRTEMKDIALTNESLLPKLAERLFSLQNTLEDQKLLLKNAQKNFAFFYSQAEIRYLPVVLTNATLRVIYRYSTKDDWESFVSLLSQNLTLLTQQLQNYL